VDAGDTDVEPLAERVPTPLSMVTLVPPLLQFSVDEPPAEMVVGDAVNEKRQPWPDEIRSEKLP
jgi:hypothetical protein